MGWIDGGCGIDDLRCGSGKAGVEGLLSYTVMAVTVSVGLQEAPATVGGRYGCTHIIRVKDGWLSKRRPFEAQDTQDRRSPLRSFVAGGWAFGAQRCCAPTGWRLLGADEVASAVLLPAGFVALGAEGLFFAEADGADAVGGDAQGDEILLDGAGAAIA